MALMLNTVQLAGNLTRDPEVKNIGNDRVVASFGLAINRKYRSASGEQKEETTFVEIECWGRQAELVGQYLSKGRNCLVEGELQYHKWTDKNGSNRSQIRVLGKRVHFIGGAPQGGQAASSSSEQAPTPARQTVPDYDDEPPF